MCICVYGYERMQDSGEGFRTSSSVSKYLGGSHGCLVVLAGCMPSQPPFVSEKKWTKVQGCGP